LCDDGEVGGMNGFARGNSSAPYLIKITRTFLLSRIIPSLIKDLLGNEYCVTTDSCNSRSRLPKLITQYIPKGRRDRGRPMKKMTDSEAGTGQH
jgi:hypothetical protein